MECTFFQLQEWQAAWGLRPLMPPQSWNWKEIEAPSTLSTQGIPDSSQGDCDWSTSQGGCGRPTPPFGSFPKRLPHHRHREPNSFFSFPLRWPSSSLSFLLPVSRCSPWIPICLSWDKPRQVPAQLASRLANFPAAMSFSIPRVSPIHTKCNVKMLLDTWQLKLTDHPCTCRLILF